MSARRLHFIAIAQLAGTLAAAGAFDDYEPPTVVPAEPEPTEPFGDHCCWANYMISSTTHNADCGEAARATSGGV